jgi:hypothetical protein
MKYRQKPLPSDAELLAEAHYLWAYDAERGGFVWARRRYNGQPKPGTPVGGSDGRGYRMTLLLGHKFKVHQLVWLWHRGALPPQPLDHINRKRSDNRIENLRLATDQQNVWNSNPNAAGVKRWRKRWAAVIDVGGKKHYLGAFDTRQEATARYRAVAQEVRGEFAPDQSSSFAAISSIDSA